MLLTKIHIPETAKNYVHRRILNEKLNEGLDRKLILVSAPAGYGKTTLICDWIRETKIPAAWYSVDHRDNDPSEFLSFIISSINTVHKDIGSQSLELLKSQSAVSTDYILELLINDLLEVDSDFLLVVDDIHVVYAKEIFAIMQTLVEHSPAFIKIAILTRADPPLNLSRLRSRNELTEIRSMDLSFSENDISELFNRKLKLGLNDDDIQIIKSKTEGWIAGLQLAALSLQGKDNVSDFIKSIAGSNRYIVDYLMEEVLNIQNQEIKDFLLQTSILDKLSGSLCDAVLKRDNSQSILETLEKGNMFIIPLDNNRTWFRYHHLFRDLLQQKLALSNKNQIPDFHNEASNWFEKNDLTQMAVEHALKAGNIQKGFELLEGILDYLVQTSQYALILRYAELFSGEEVVSTTKHDILYAWSLTITGNLREAEEILGKLDKKLTNEKPDPVTSGLLATMYTTYALLNDFKGNDEASLNYSKLALDHAPPEDFVWRSWAWYCKAGPHLLRLELDEGISSLSNGLESATNTKNSYLEIVHNKIAFLLKLKGKYAEALDYCNSMLQNAQHNYDNEGLESKLFASVLYSTIGAIIVEQGKTNEGIEMALKGFNLSQKLISISFRGYSRYLLAEVYYKTGDFENALKTIDNHDANLEGISRQWLAVLSNALKLKILTRLDQKEKADLFYEHCIKDLNMHAFGSALYRIASAHYFIYTGRFEEAEALLSELSAVLKKKGILELLFEVELMRTRVFIDTGRKEEAVVCLADLLIWTREEGFVQSYVQEGEIVAGLVKEMLRDKQVLSQEPFSGISRKYLTALNRAIEIEHIKKEAQSDGNLSNRELEILELISQKLSNKEICDTLYISLPTVKTHISNIFLKLEVKNRVEAVEIAKERGLI